MYKELDEFTGYSFIKNMDFLKYFFEMVFMDHDSEGTIYIEKLKYLAEYNGVGVEGAGGHYDPNEDDYKEGYFTLDFYSPSPFEKVTYVENNTFYKELADLCAEHMKIRPEDKECVEKYLRVIKQNLKLCF